MVLFSILFFIIIYIGLAILFVFVVGKITKRELFWWLAVAFVILLPTWDVILGLLVYFPACRFIPKAAIYETAEADGIYYERENDCYQVLPNSGLIVVDHTEEPLMKGFKYAESKINREYRISMQGCIAKTPSIYRCKSLPKEEDDPRYVSHFQSSCSVIDKPQSNYLVKVRTFKIGVTEINCETIYNRKSNKLMAKQYMANLVGGFFWPPFFNWLNWSWWNHEGGNMSCPDAKLFDEFEFKVLKPKK
jgi:hypothetical protein